MVNTFSKALINLCYRSCMLEWIWLPTKCSTTRGTLIWGTREVDTGTHSVEVHFWTLSSSSYVLQIRTPMILSIIKFFMMKWCDASGETSCSINVFTIFSAKLFILYEHVRWIYWAYQSNCVFCAIVQNLLLLQSFKMYFVNL